MVSRRQRAARGTIINSAFQVGIGGLNLLKTVIVAGFLLASEYAIWSILLLTLLLFAALKMAAVSDKYVQQSEPDQEAAFQKAFSLELISAAALTLLMAATAPLLVVIYGHGELLLPGLALALMMPGLALQAPIWVFYRRMQFVRQRLLLSVDPVVGFAITIWLASSGFGYWSLIWGAVAGAWVGGVVAMVVSPYPFAFRFERSTMREYVSFSWPVLVATAGGIVMAPLSMFFGDLAVGLAGAGAIGLAGTFAAYTNRVNALVTATLYPAICRVRDRTDLLVEAFTKSNRLTLMWGVPFGIGLALFAADLVEFGIGTQWAHALVLLQVWGLVSAINHIGVNWSAFYRAAGITRPLATVTLISLATFLGAAVPLLFAYGLSGFAAGMALVAAASLVARWYYVTRLFPGFDVMLHTLRALVPSVPAVVAVLIARNGLDLERTAGLALGELALYLAVTVLATWAFERALIREAVGYLRSSPAAA